MSSSAAIVQRLQSRIKNMKDEAKAATVLGTNALLVVAGGAAAGALSAKLPTLPGSTFSTPGAVGGTLVALAMTGAFDEESDKLALFGAGMLASIAARETEKILAA